MKKQPLKSPFPYFGGKSKVANIVWDRLGNPENYVEPFAGSLAVLLRRPETGKVETVNDRNHFIVNFWRAVKHDRAGVVEYSDSPVTEADLHARHEWLINSEQSFEFRNRIESDPDFYDSRFAGWWVWGQCCWIGAGWCDGYGRNSDDETWNARPTLKDQGLVRCSRSMPRLSNDAELISSVGHNKKKPILNANFDKVGTGIHAKRPSLPCDRGVASMGRPQLGDAFDIGRGVNGNKRAGTCAERKAWLSKWIDRLSDRLRLVRVCYGSWERICDSKTTMDRLGTTGAFLDPPYAKNVDRAKALIRGEEFEPAKSTNRADEIYAGDKDQDIDQLVADVNKWCQRWGANPNVRIGLCGYEGEHSNLIDLGWNAVSWKAQGGYANRNKENQNKTRERIWFSPACKQERTLF